MVSFDKTDIFSEYLEKVSLASSFFSNENVENKRRIKSFERICFMIYCGDRDKYSKKLGSLIEKMSKVIKSTETAHPALLILILFCLRILILRLSAITLNHLLSNIWPIVLTLLIQIFQRSKSGFQNNQRNPNLILAGLKLMEMISIMQLESFYVHEWLFVYD